MSLAALRRWSRVVAGCLLLLTVLGATHAGRPDDVCLPPGEQHDESKHIVTQPESPEHVEHCAVCHWLRTAQPEPGAATQIDRRDGVRAVAIIAGPGALRDRAPDRLPARAPPFSLL